MKRVLLSMVLAAAPDDEVGAAHRQDAIVVGVAAQVDIDDMASSMFQTNGHIFPHFARLAKAMQQNNGRIIGRTNIVGLKPDACKPLKFSHIS
jgi:hypothetical protein